MSKMIVVFEGINGSGKTVQIKELKARLQESGRACEVLYDPGSTPLGDKLRWILKRAEHPIDPMSQTLLFTAARRSLLPKVLELHKKGVVVILDRWWFSTYAYQCAQGVDRGWVEELSTRCSELFLNPELCLLLDVDPTVATKRVAKVRVSQGTDRFERKGREFQVEVREMYLELVPEKLTLIDCGDHGAGYISDEVWERVEPHLKG